MRIGIDLDGVVFDTEKEFRVYSELYDAKDLNQNSKVDNREFRFQDRFNWTEEELKGFLEKYHKQIILEANYLPGAKRVLNFLKQSGHTLILISARGTLLVQAFIPFSICLDDILSKPSLKLLKVI